MALAAWALTVSRRAGLDDLVLGCRRRAGSRRAWTAWWASAPGRPGRCAANDDSTVREFVRGIADALAAAVADADVPFEKVVSALGAGTDPDGTRWPSSASPPTTSWCPTSWWWATVPGGCTRATAPARCSTPCSTSSRGRIVPGSRWSTRQPC
ncbi:hypothetical protein NKG94_50210 [Micromonospora sp. M12]